MPQKEYNMLFTTRSDWENGITTERIGANLVVSQILKIGNLVSQPSENFKRIGTCTKSRKEAYIEERRYLGMNNLPVTSVHWEIFNQRVAETELPSTAGNWSTLMITKIWYFSNFNIQISPWNIRRSSHNCTEAPWSLIATCFNSSAVKFICCCYQDQ